MYRTLPILRSGAHPFDATPLDATPLDATPLDATRPASASASV